MSNFTPIYLPQSGPNDVTATLAAWSKQPGQWVQKGEVVGSAETTKSVFDLEAPAAGIFWPLAAVGSDVPIGGVVAALGPEQSNHAAAQAWLAAQTTSLDAAGALPQHSGGRFEAGSGAMPAGASRAMGTPRPATLKAELLAHRHNLDLSQIPAQGEKITEADVQAYLASPAPPTMGGAATPTAASSVADLVDDSFPAARVQRLLLIGGGKGAVQIIDALARLSHQRAVAILDDNAAIHGKTVAGVPILGAIDLARAADMAAAGLFDAAVISISTSIPTRMRIFEQWKSGGIAFANVIHPSCVIGLNVTWGEGNVVMAFCHFGACAAIGDNNFLSAYCSVEHHCILGSHCSFGPAVVTSSRVTFGDRVRCGTGIAIEPGIHIGEGSVIASGLAITEHIPPDSVLKAHKGYSIRPR